MVCIGGYIHYRAPDNSIAITDITAGVFALVHSKTKFVDLISLHWTQNRQPTAAANNVLGRVCVCVCQSDILRYLRKTILCICAKCLPHTRYTLPWQRLTSDAEHIQDG